MRVLIIAAALLLSACTPEESPAPPNEVGTISQLVMTVDNCRIYRIWLPNEDAPRYLTRATRGSTAYCGLSENVL